MENPVEKSQCILTSICPWQRACDRNDWWNCLHAATELEARREAEWVERVFDIRETV